MTHPLDQLPPDLRDLDRASREEVSNWAACILIDITPHEGLVAMVQGGKQQFMQTAGDRFHGQDFKYEDIEKIWRLINAYVTRGLQPAQVLRG